MLVLLHTLLSNSQGWYYMHDIDVNRVLTAITRHYSVANARPRQHLTPIVSTHPALQLTSTDIINHPKSPNNCGSNLAAEILISSKAFFSQHFPPSQILCTAVAYPQHFLANLRLSHTAGKRKPLKKLDKPKPGST